MSNIFVVVKMVSAAIQASLYKHFGIIKSQKGVSMMEYALIAALISVVAIAALQSVGSNVKNAFNNVSGQIAGAI
jgi:pilus assembly protein Flp/PilA